MLSNPLTKTLFVLCAILLGQRVYEYVRIQGSIDDRYVVPIILLAILGHLAFPSRPSK